MTLSEYRRELGRRLRRERAYAGFTLEQIEELGVMTTSTLSRVENGSGAIRFEKLLELAGLYDVALDRLLEELVPLGEPPSATRASSNRERQRQAA